MIKLKDQVLLSEDKSVEILNEHLIRIYTKKNSSNVIRLNINKSNIDITQNENQFSFGNYEISFSNDNEVIITTNKHPLFTESCTRVKSPFEGDTKYKTQINFSLIPEVKTYVYGLGDKAAFLNRYGYNFISWNTDDPTPHNEQYKSLYKSINFFIVNEGGIYYGVFYPCAFKCGFDFAKENKDLITIASKQGEYDYFLILGSTPAEIIKEYSSLVNRPVLPRIKMLGNQQSRWSYYSEKEVRKISQLYKQYKLPLDYIHLDIDHMDNFKNLTIDKTRFPNMKALSDDLKKDGVELVSIFDAGVKLEIGYPLCDNLIKDKMVLTLNGKPYVNTVWPGDSIFPNYFHSETREYVSSEIISFLEKNGISGIWCDMNEPASFNGPFDDNVKGKVTTYGNIYHNEFHNLYGEYMARCVAKAFNRRNIRPFVITRAAFASTSQYAVCWNGDNQSLWSHLENSLSQIATMNICNFPFDGVDIGGFNGDCSKELLLRWIEANIFSPFLRNHSAYGTKGQEPWKFDEETINIYRKMLNLRYELIPYLYDLCVRAHFFGTPVIRPLFYDFPFDENGKEINDEVMIGECLLLAPIVKQGAKSRIVYLPDGVWYNYFTHEKYDGGREIILRLNLDEVGLFVKEGSILPKWRNVQHIDLNKIDELIFDCSYGDGETRFYEDDGTTFNCNSSEYNLYHFVAKDKQYTLTYKFNYYKSNYKHFYAFDGERNVELLITK